jgi:hypothetical protein
MSREEQHRELDIQRKLGIACIVVFGGFCLLFAVVGSVVETLLH